MQVITTEHIEFLKPAKQGFFEYKQDPQLRCHCLVVGQIKLPIAPCSNLFYLVHDRAGEYHWLPGNKVSLSFHSDEPWAVDSSTPQKKASWFRFLYNGYEPDNLIQLTGELTSDGTRYVVFQMSGRLVFRDGEFFVSISRTEDQKFLWRKDDITGIADSFIEAWENMPAYVKSPDHEQESPIFFNNLPLRDSVSDGEVIAGQSEF